MARCRAPTRGVGSPLPQGRLRYCTSSPDSSRFIFSTPVRPQCRASNLANLGNLDERMPIKWILQRLLRSKFCLLSAFCQPFGNRRSRVDRSRMQGVSYSMPQIKSLIKFSIRLFLLGMVLAVIGFTILWLIIVPSLPSVDTLRDVELQVPLRIYSADDRLITTVGEQRRIPLTIDEIPLALKQAFLAAEDDNFYGHPGIDWRGTLRGVFGYVRYLGQRRVPGGSTITQQVARR